MISGGIAMRVAYIRVSSESQNTDRQLAEIQVDRTFTEKLSGKSLSRPVLQEMVSFIRDGDEVHVHSLDRLARNLQDLLKLTEQITAKGASLHFHKEGLSFKGDGADPMAKLLLGVLGSFAEFERSLILERQREGIALAKAKGAYKGSKPKLSGEQIQELKGRIAKGEKKAAVARSYGISTQTLYTYLRSESAVGLNKEMN